MKLEGRGGCGIVEGIQTANRVVTVPPVLLQQRPPPWANVSTDIACLPAGCVHLCMYVCRCKQGVVLLLSTAVFSITRSLEAEPLLACVTSGMLLANKR